MGAHSAENAEVRGVRVPDERLDAREANLTTALTWVPHPYRVPATRDLAALVQDLRDARADNQRLREALLLALNVLGDERLHPEASDTPLGVPGCLACDAIAAGEMALAEEPRA